MTPRRRPTKFAADAMLGSLARKLRALGFDTTYCKSGGDADLLRGCAREGRILLTSDVALLAVAAKARVPAIGVTGHGDGERLSCISSVAKGAGMPLTRGEPLCSLCNSPLSRETRASIAGRVPPSVASSHREFYRCVGCGQVYWKGSHWKKLRSLGRRLAAN